LDANYAIGNFIRDALHGGPIVIKGDGTPFRSYLYAADLAIWLWTILVRGQSRRPYNIGSDEPLTIEEVAQHVMEQFQYKVFILVLSSPNPSMVLEQYIPGVNQAKIELGLDIWISLDTAIQKTIKYYQENL
jgi:dTDP-glucose 4,6-dehydratase